MRQILLTVRVSSAPTAAPFSLPLRCALPSHLGTAWYGQLRIHACTQFAEQTLLRQTHISTPYTPASHKRQNTNREGMCVGGPRCAQRTAQHVPSAAVFASDTARPARRIQATRYRNVAQWHRPTVVMQHDIPQIITGTSTDAGNAARSCTSNYLCTNKHQFTRRDACTHTALAAGLAACTNTESDAHAQAHPPVHT